ncbi:MAG TPA: hypothetical protein VK540_23885 [Polyangiaceae bacterium]|nr:hypothetical protein [Polyangiaceae bacterium]
MRISAFNLAVRHVSPSTRGKWIGCCALALPLACGLVGCTAEVRTAHPTVAVEEDVVVAPAPVNVYAYPHTVYRGEPVYYVDGRWYHRRGQRWGYYRHEPPGLVRHRRQVEVAPPARRFQPAPGEAIRVR